MEIVGALLMLAIVFVVAGLPSHGGVRINPPPDYPPPPSPPMPPRRNR